MDSGRVDVPAGVPRVAGQEVSKPHRPVGITPTRPDPDPTRPAKIDTTGEQP